MATAGPGMERSAAICRAERLPSSRLTVPSRERFLAEARSSPGKRRAARPPRTRFAAPPPGPEARNDPGPPGPRSADRPRLDPVVSRLDGSAPASVRHPGSERRPGRRADSAAPGRAARRRLDGPVRPIDQSVRPESRPISRLPPEAPQADRGAVDRRFDPGGGSPPSPTLARSSRASGRPAIRARRPGPLPRPGRDFALDPDRPRFRRRPGPEPQPAAPA